MKIPDHQLRYTLEERHPPGGQTCGSMPSGVMVEHIMSGLVAAARFERSQLKNKARALEMIGHGLAGMGLTQDDIDRITPEVMRQQCAGPHPSVTFKQFSSSP